VHLVRVTAKCVNIVHNACIRKGVTFRNHTSTDRLSEIQINEFFKEPLTQHIVLGVKGFFRRANLIPNRWKLRIGATHELCVKNVDNNVQVQGLPGRMTGYWRDDIERGHKTGPHRTSIKAIKEYEATYLDPFGSNSYHTAGFNKRKGKVTSEPTMLSAKNILNLEAVELPVVKNEEVNINLYRIYSDEETVRKVCMILGYTFKESSTNKEGFKETSFRIKKKVVRKTLAREERTWRRPIVGSVNRQLCEKMFWQIENIRKLVFWIYSKPAKRKIGEHNGNYPRNNDKHYQTFH
jgi:hypothetical protein